jgi:hypothetical protein
VLLSLLRLDLQLHQALEIARLVCPGLCRVQTARARGLHADRRAVVLCPHEFVHLVYRLQKAKTTHVLHLRRALQWLRGADGRRVCLFHAQPVLTIRLTRALLYSQGPRDRFCRAGQAYLPDRAPRPLDSCHQPVPACPPHARQHESAAEHSLDFRL